VFPQYYKESGDRRGAVAAKDVPAETKLREQRFPVAVTGDPYPTPTSKAWTHPGPASSPQRVQLADGSVVTYVWYRFVDQPSFRQYAWTDEKKAALQTFVAKIHAAWPIDRDYMSPPGKGSLVALDPGLIVTPPKGLEHGYVPIVIGQVPRAGKP
jgi:hypothetical protein